MAQLSNPLTHGLGHTKGPMTQQGRRALLETDWVSPSASRIGQGLRAPA